MSEKEIARLQQWRLGIIRHAREVTKLVRIYILRELYQYNQELKLS